MRDGEVRLYMDDPVLGVVGPRLRRRYVLAMLLYAAAAGFPQGREGSAIVLDRCSAGVVVQQGHVDADRARQNHQRAAGEVVWLEREGHHSVA